MNAVVRPLGTDGPTPHGWRAKPAGRWAGRDVEVVDDPRRHDVLVATNGLPDRQWEALRPPGTNSRKSPAGTSCGSAITSRGPRWRGAHRPHPCRCRSARSGPVTQPRPATDELDGARATSARMPRASARARAVLRLPQLPGRCCQSSRDGPRPSSRSISWSMSAWAVRAAAGRRLAVWSATGGTPRNT
jgi:hypothetical protein